MRLVPRTMRGWATLSVAVLVIIGVVSVAIWAIWGWSSIAAKPTKRGAVPTASVTLTPGNLDNTRNLFGPWELALSNTTGAPALVLLRQSGSVEVSSWTVSVDDTWSKSDPALIAAVSAGEQQVTFTSEHNVFTVDYGQAFVFAAQPDRVYAFMRSDSDSYIIVTTTVDRAHQLGHSYR